MLTDYQTHCDGAAKLIDRSLVGETIIKLPSLPSTKGNHLVAQRYDDHSGVCHEIKIWWIIC